ncbi:glycosyltransferase family 2 protein [Winogradskyella psychrotolerans]|uniref:glycosyltransferase family 2 protein n=1 Tax=Winogradskyella psychrotolerans TaxID=1344585 RepID=UPI001C064F8C|nr:glycosyltransferase family 2 protein [Winogradskyella psychrotolerans]MBU2929553.1 glycosyltransferase family 2 protein [Winogradskyella psychrotolerans]
MEKFVSVILPNYNHEAYLEERLNSIFNQTYQSFEVIILDDCSTDESLEILKPYETHPKVAHLISNKKNSGSPFIQWQKGLELAKGDLIWIAESDDFCDLNFLETQIEVLQSADVAVAKTMAYLKGTSINEVRHPIFDSDKQKDSILYCPILNVSSVLFKASEFETKKNNFYTGFNIIGDRVFYYEFFRNSKIIYNKNTTSYFRQSESNTSKLEGRSLPYYSQYLKEHYQFIQNAKTIEPIRIKPFVKVYYTRFFNRVRDRVTKRQKFSINYIKLFMVYKFKKLI